MKLPRLALLLLLPLLAACDSASTGPKPGAPPVSFRYRQAQIPGKGLVAGIENQSTTETLSNFVIKVSSQDAQRNGSYRVGKFLEPEDSMTIGWVELDGWELQADDRISVTCEQYAEAATSTVTRP
jgi:hypothetical protein